MGTMCFDIRRVDNDHVCIYRMGLNAFDYIYHHPQSSWPSDGYQDGILYDYLIIAKSKYRGGIETIVHTTTNKANADEQFRGCLDGTGIFFDEDKYDYRMVKIPVYRHRYVGWVTFKDGTKARAGRTDEIIHHDDYKLWCPVSLNRKHRVYWVWSDKRKPKGGCYGHGPRRIKGRRKKDVQD